MPKLKIALELAGLRQPFRKALHTAAELGVEAVEIDARGELSPREISRTGLRQVRKLLDDLNLTVAAVSFRSRRGYATLDGLDQRLEATRAAMEMAHQLGASILVGAIGPIPSDEDADARRVLLDVLADLGRHSHRSGAIFATETGMENGKTLAKLLSELPEGTLAVDLNPGRLLVHGHSPLAAVESLGRSIVHVHVSDALRGPGSARDEYTAVGRGHADYPAILGALEEYNYLGYFTVQLPAAFDPLSQAGQALNYLRSL